METSVWIRATQYMPLTLGVGGVRGKQDNKEPWQLYGAPGFPTWTAGDRELTMGKNFQDLGFQ